MLNVNTATTLMNARKITKSVKDRYIKSAFFHVIPKSRANDDVSCAFPEVYAKLPPAGPYADLWPPFFLLRALW